MYENIIPKIKIHEGSIPHMYLDTRGFVTVAVGQLLASPEAAKAMPFVHQSSQQLASDEEIEQEYTKIKAQQAGKLASYYKQFTTLELQDDEIDKVLISRIEEFNNGLEREFNGFNAYPEQSKEALLDMAFNLGLSGLVRKFPKLKAAAEEGDWQTCANECTRRGIGDERNEYTRGLFEQA